MSPGRTRTLLRWAHVAAAGVLGTYLYSPWSAEPVFRAVTLFVAFPLLALSGVWMWQQGRIARLFRRDG